MYTTDLITAARDPLWQFIGVLLALAALILTYFIFTAQRLRKGITYQRLAGYPILTVNEEHAGRLTVTYDGEPVKTIHLTILRIRNSGNQPILPTDYIAPLSLYAQAGAKILSADIVAVSPHNLRAGISLKKGAAVADSVLLNPGDFFDVKILAQDGSEWMIVEGRLVGVQAIQRVLDPDSKLEFLSIIGMLAFALGIMIQVSTRTPRLSIPTTLGENIGNFIAVSGVLVWISCTVLKFWRKRQTSDKK
jgi:hypothetical protein